MTAAELNDYLVLALSAATLAGVLIAWRKRQFARFRNWMRSVKSRKKSTEAMVASWPTIFEFVKDASNRDDKAASRESRVTAEFAGLREHLERQDKDFGAKLDSIIAHQWGAMKLDPQARFICDSDGKNNEVNTAYATLLRVGESSLKGFGYKNYLDPANSDKYLRAVMQAFGEHRRFEGTVGMIRGDGTKFLAHVRLEPYPEDPSMGSASHWFGAVTMVEELGR